MKLMICNECGWAHFPRSKNEVLQEAKSFEEYIMKQSDEIKAQFGLGPLSKYQKDWNLVEEISKQEKCFHCGNSNDNFHEETEQDNIPVGCTIQGIILNSKE